MHKPAVLFVKGLHPALFELARRLVRGRQTEIVVESITMLSGFLLGEIEGGVYHTASLETSKAGLDAKRQTQCHLPIALSTE